MAAVDEKLVRNWTGGRHFLENALPDTALGPTIVAIVDGRRWPIGWRNVAPPASCFQHMQDAGKDSPIVHARFSRLEADGVPTTSTPHPTARINSLPCPLPPATQIMAKIYHGINALYGYST